MKYIFTSFFAAVFLLLAAKGYAQPLPCPPLTTTWVQAYGDTTICLGSCTTLTSQDSTSAKATSSYSYSTIPYLPTAFSGGTPVIVGIDDIYSGVVPIPFDFCFYGVKYNSCVIGANGNMCFNTDLAGAYDPWPISGPISPTSTELNTATLNAILGVYQDIDPALGGVINWAIYGTAPCRTFVVSWDNVPYFDAGYCPGYINTQQIVLYESTYAIDIFVQQKPACTAWNNGWGILGIVDETGANYNIPTAYNATVFAMDSMAFRFTPNAPATWTYSWTDVTTGAVVSTGSSAYVCPTANTTYSLTAKASTNCDTYTVYSSATVLIGPQPTITHTSVTNATMCGLQNGSIKLYGLVPGISDTIYYNYNGALQPYVVQTSLSDSSLTLLNLCAGTYDSITVVVGMCHTNSIALALTAAPLPIGSASTTPPSVCLASDATLTINGLLPSVAYTVNYTEGGVAQTPATGTSSPTGTLTITGLTAGTYDNINASGSIGPCLPEPCTTGSIGPFIILDPPAYVVNIDSFASPSQCGYCDGRISMTSVLPYVSDTVFYSFNGIAQTPFVNIALGDSSVYLPGLCAGAYSNITIKVGPCSSVVPGGVNLVSPTITDSFSYTNHYGCNGDTVMFNNTSSSTGPLSYVWSFGDGATDTNANPMHVYAQGIYTVTLRANDYYCDTTFSLSDSLEHPLKASFVDTPYIYCGSSPVTLTNTSDSGSAGVITYEWLFGDGSSTDSAFSTVHTYAKAGVYNVQLIATNFVPCSDTASLTVYIDSASAISLAVTDTTLCKSGAITFQGYYSDIGNTSITWYFGDGDSVVNVNPVTHAYDGVGTFTVTATADYRKCDDTSVSKVVTVFQRPTIDLGPDTSICKGSATITLADLLNAGNENATWIWSTGQTSPSIVVTEPGNYSVTVDINGCYATDSVSVSNDCYMNVPNVFTPNGDGINDYFYPLQTLSAGLISFKMDVYNRWGQLLFEGTSLDGRGWDGKFNGVDQQEGVYVYTIDAIFKDGEKEHHQGNVTLLR